MTADLIIVNANIQTMTEPAATADALAITGNLITAVGSNDQIRALATERTHVVDAEGRIVLPGFVEAHMHLFPGAQGLAYLQAGEIEDEASLRRAVRAFAADNPDEDLLVVQAVQYTVLGDDRPITRHDIDAIVADRPVLMVAGDLHNGWANTIALDRAGLLHGLMLDHAEVEMAADGLATGFLKEFGAVLPVMALRSKGGRENLGFDGVEPENVTEDQRAYDLQVLRDGLTHCAELGITTIINMDGNRYQLELLADLAKSGNLHCRVEIPYHFTPGEALANLERAVDMRRDFAGDLLWSRRVKLFMDGVIEARTALMLEDYPDHPGERGTRLHSPEEFAAVICEADRLGFQISVHAVGDGAVSAVLDGYQAARDNNGSRDARHRIEHIEQIALSDIARFRDLGVIASFQPPHCPGAGVFPLEPSLSITGQKNWHRAFLWRDMAEAGVRLCFSSDWPVAPLSPIAGIACAMSRQPWHPDLSDQRLPIEQVLHAYTAGGAYASHLEDRLGTLAPGMAADIVMLSATGEPQQVEWSQTQVDLTVMDGRITFARQT
ncbi:MAG: amidohydrolase [Rhodobacteraceae bacterium]|nr:amidohydrolase [Paracoccaceae bacterium]